MTTSSLLSSRYTREDDCLYRIADYVGKELVQYKKKVREDLETAEQKLDIEKRELEVMKKDLEIKRQHLEQEYEILNKRKVLLDEQFDNTFRFKKDGILFS